MAAQFAQMSAEKAAALRNPFDPKQIGKLPKGGVMLDFVGHAAVTDRLLQVDSGWSWEPMATDERGLPALDAEGNLWILLTICGVTRPGVGDGKSMKERIGDAIRNAAMRFGVALDLWAKEDLTPPNPLVAAKHRVKAAWEALNHGAWDAAAMTDDYAGDLSDAAALNEYAARLEGMVQPS